MYPIVCVACNDLFSVNTQDSVFPKRTTETASLAPRQLRSRSWRSTPEFSRGLHPELCRVSRHEFAVFALSFDGALSVPCGVLEATFQMLSFEFVR